MVTEAKLRYPEIPENILNHILHCYGSSYENVLKRIRDNPTLAEKISPDSDSIKSQVVYAVEKEMAMTLEDVILRRTDIALTGKINKGELQDIGKLMGELLSWDERQVENEIGSAWNLLVKKNIKKIEK